MSPIPKISPGISDEILRVANSIIDDYDKDRAIDNMDGMFCQPDREIIFESIRNLLRIIYPGFFSSKTYKIYNASSRVYVLLEDVQFHLSKQIAIALSYGKNLDEQSREQNQQYAEKITLKFLGQIPKIRAYLEEDLHTAFDSDPAALNIGEIIISYPGIFAISIHRLAHELSVLGVPLIPRVMSEYAHSRTGIDIHPNAQIGHNFFIDHGTGIVIGESTIIGNNVKIYQGVTLGALSTHGGQALRNKKRHPTIEDNVIIYSNASILGGETVVGHDSVIGGNAFVTKSVKPGSRVSVRTHEQQLVDIREKAKAADPKDECWYYQI